MEKDSNELGIEAMEIMGRNQLTTIAIDVAYDVASGGADFVRERVRVLLFGDPKFEAEGEMLRSENGLVELTAVVRKLIEAKAEFVLESLKHEQSRADQMIAEFDRLKGETSEGLARAYFDAVLEKYFTFDAAEQMKELVALKHLRFELKVDHAASPVYQIPPQVYEYPPNETYLMIAISLKHLSEEKEKVIQVVPL